LTKADFKNLFDKHFDAVRNYIYYRSGDPEMATDIAQDTFLTLWEKQLKIENESGIKGLIYKIAHDNFISKYRRESVSAKFKLSLSETVNLHTPEAELQFDELKAKYERTLMTMPEKQRVVFLMSRMDNMKYHEIAEVNGITVKAVEKRMKNALSFLRQGLEY
jgi:RNA polymerase sigma-70 factor (family 1)